MQFFHGPVIRPQTDADSLFIEVTSGCTHNSCTFCNFYRDTPFRVAPLEQVEAALQEAAREWPDAPRIWASGGNPYGLSVRRLEALAELFRRYMPQAKISTYARIDDICRKTPEEIRHLKEIGFADLVVGMESADDEVLTHTKKGYSAADILEAGKKLDQAGVKWRIIYLAGLAGKGKCVASAEKTAAVLSELHPYFMHLTTVSLVPGTELYREMQKGEFEPAGEREKLEEFRTLIAGFRHPIDINAETSTNMVRFSASLPADQKPVTEELLRIIESITPEKDEMLRRRRMMMTAI